MTRKWLTITAFGILSIAPLAGAQAPTGVRGVIESRSGSKLVIKTPQGSETVALAQGVQAFTRVPAKTTDLGPNSFVGITSVKGADGSETATEIHIFPEVLRGLGEGSRLMGTSGPGGRPNRMTNGTVKNLGQANRMTNGAVKQMTHGVVTLTYKGGTRTIDVPDTVEVTKLAPIDASQLKAGMAVFALGTKQKNGTWIATRVMLTKPPTGAKVNAKK